ncbi:EnvZ/OmpR regulon moderator MzrA [Siccibacter turicensis]|uniref:Modulator protein MzrA n=1 Tax=Siccibacter turicensis TaxID=357233 RepID=A0A2P8VFF8_9ENTR|nr:EnvZ/OmpR regulon moderator MzrA [Siccibacter turicensis]PSN06281.1 Modulator protein MzrA [Siccibacter turicensis]
MRIVRSRRSIIWLTGIALAVLLVVAGSALQSHESTLAIRPSSHGASMPDGFSVLHHLDANGITIKSITPQDDILLIKFDSSAERDAARRVLYRTLPRGFIIAQEEEKSPAPHWLQRLRGEGHRLG